MPINSVVISSDAVIPVFMLSNVPSALYAATITALPVGTLFKKLSRKCIVISVRCYLRFSLASSPGLIIGLVSSGKFISTAYNFESPKLIGRTVIRFLCSTVRFLTFFTERQKRADSDNLRFYNRLHVLRRSAILYKFTASTTGLLLLCFHTA